MRRLTALVSSIVLLATIVLGPWAAGASAAIYGQQTTGGFATWRSGPFTFMGYADAYRFVRISISKQANLGRPLERCVEYFDETYRLGGDGVSHLQLSMTTSEQVCEPGDVQVSLLLDRAQLPPTQVPTIWFTEGVGGGHGSVTIGIQLTATGPAQTRPFVNHCGTDCVEYGLTSIRPATATATVDGTSLGPPSGASLGWIAILSSM